MRYFLPFKMQHMFQVGILTTIILWSCRKPQNDGQSPLLKQCSEAYSGKQHTLFQKWYLFCFFSKKYTDGIQHMYQQGFSFVAV